MHALGVLVPIQFRPVKVLPGRHPLGRAGEGMRLLRTRPYVPGEDNPRDIDKFSPPDERRVMEWEDEARASIMLLADVSASMSPPLKSSLRNACLLQLTYSLWRAGDRVGTIFFDSSLRERVCAANLRIQMQQMTSVLRKARPAVITDLSAALSVYFARSRHRQTDLLFVISDFVAADGVNLNAEAEWRILLNQVKRNVIPVVISFKISESSAGVIKFWDPERETRRIVWLSPRRIRRINREENGRVSSLAAQFRSAGLDYMILSSQREIYPQLTRLARARRLRKH